MFFLMGCIFNYDLYQEKLRQLQDYDNDGFTIEDGDCNDDNPLIKPNAIEVCDWLDNDCNGINDDLEEFPMWFLDRDRDGFGNPGINIATCFPEDNRYTDQGGDCDDSDPEIHPNNSENWENAFVDNNCDAWLDEKDLLVEEWSPFLNLNYRGYWSDGEVALMIKNEATPFSSIHWLRAIDQGISLTPLMMASDARQSQTGHLLVTHGEFDDAVFVYDVLNGEEAVHEFVFSGTVKDMEVLGDVTGDGRDDILVLSKEAFINSTNDSEYELIVTSLLGYPRVDVSTFDWRLNTPYNLVDGDYVPLNDWNDDGLNDVLLHHSDGGNFSVYTNLDDPDLLVPYTYISDSCSQVYAGIFIDDNPVIACVQTDGIFLYESENDIDPLPAFEISPPAGGSIEGLSMLDHEMGGVAVLYSATDSSSAIALIHPEWLSTQQSHVISGLEPHVYTEAALRQINYLGPVHQSEPNPQILISHGSAGEYRVGVFTVPDL